MAERAPVLGPLVNVSALETILGHLALRAIFASGIAAARFVTTVASLPGAMHRAARSTTFEPHCNGSVTGADATLRGVDPCRARARAVLFALGARTTRVRLRR